jgi:hypothetical protein
MSRAVLPVDDVQFRKYALEFEAAMKSLPNTGGLSRRQMAKLRTAIEEFEMASARHLEVRELLADLAREKEIKRAPVKNLLFEFVTATGYDPKAMEQARKHPKASTPSEQPEPRSDAYGTPSLRLESELGKVIVYFGEVPDWASGVCIYRRQVGETEYDMRHFAHQSPYEDEVTGSSAEYEYRARYWVRATNELSKPCEPVRITAGGELVAAQ